MKLPVFLTCLFVLAGCSLQTLVIPDEPYDPTDPNRPPHMLAHGDIEYPDLAREVKIEGKITVELTIDESGAVTHVEILDRDFNYSAVYLRDGTLKPVKDIFDEPLIRFYESCKYTPGYHDGIPVVWTIRTGMSFKLYR